MGGEDVGSLAPGPPVMEFGGGFKDRPGICGGGIAPPAPASRIEGGVGAGPVPPHAPRNLRSVRRQLQSHIGLPN